MIKNIEDCLESVPGRGSEGVYPVLAPAVTGGVAVLVLSQHRDLVQSGQQPLL